MQVKLALYVHSLLLMYAHVRHDAALCTVLYVEDNPANLQLVEQLIARRPNIRLLSAGDATLGIELAREQQPEAILMDINLPGISGIKALQILREDPLTQHIPVVAVSANQSIPRHRLLRIGNGPKHLKAKTLAATLKSIARNKAPQSRIVIASCLGLCPKKATAVAFAGVDPASLIVAIKSSAQLQEILPLLIGQND